MRSDRFRYLGILFAIGAACSTDSSWAPGDPGDDQQASRASGLEPTSCTNLDPPGVAVACSGEWETRSSCFQDVGGGRVRKEVAQTFIPSRTGSPGKVRMILSLRNNPTPPPEGTIWELDLEARPLRADGSIPLDSQTAVGYGTYRVENLTYREDLDLAITMTWVEEFFAGRGYAWVLSVREPADVAIGIACHSTSTEVPDVYPDGMAWTRTTRLTFDDGTVRYFTDSAFVPTTRDISFMVSILDGCRFGNTNTCGVGACYRAFPWCIDGEPIDCVPGEPVEELCDGLDQNCDEYIDNASRFSPEKVTRACYTGPDGTRNVGICSDGYQVCIAEIGSGVDTWDTCLNQVHPAPETCDGRDENCDGFVDNAVPGDPTLIRRTCYTGPAPTRGVGLCRDGTERCSASDGPGAPTWAGICDDQVLPATEVCDGFDNNCDGSVDEGNPGDGVRQGGAPCVVPGALGICAKGTWQCISGGLQCIPLYEPQLEVCDGEDDDCDGFVDNAMYGAPSKLTRHCYEGPAGSENVGVCHGGTQACNSVEEGLESWAACLGQTLPSNETCDGFDNNCDGYVDNSLPDNPALITRACYTGPEGTENVGVCHGGAQTCIAVSSSGEAAWGSCDGEVVPSDEVCDGQDNDCDGFTDNAIGGTEDKLSRSCYTGPAATQGVGVCRDGTQFCNSSQPGVTSWGSCDGQVLPAPADICDGLDNECDGFVDNAVVGVAAKVTRSCYDGPPATRNVGVCHDGIQACNAVNGAGAPSWGSCNGQTMPAAGEVCDGADNNCDGSVDEGNPGGGAACDTGLQGQCGPGTLMCVGGNIVCQGNQGPQPETCDAQDNDCDGLVDNIAFANAAPMEQSCYTGPAGTQNVGACRAGKSFCAAGVWGSCTNEVLPSAEICDNVDNDCDGAVDESVTEVCYEGPSGTAGVGVCRSGIRTCNSGAWGGCIGQVLPSDEICDAKDNNCDGLIDTADPSLVRPACELNLGVCANKTKPASLCVGGIWGACTATEYGPDYGTEVCDGKDNDCDGATDAADTSLQLVACELQQGVCSGSMKPAALCSGGTWGSCSGTAHYGPHYGAEVCDGRDNDCDGLVDAADPTLVRAPCELTQGVCAGKLHDAIQCSGGAWQACTAAQYGGSYGSEVCDGVDNDCDGLTDAADNSLALVPCELQQGVCSGSTKPASLCSGGTWGACSGTTHYGPFYGTEVCDTRDNDCNGLVDAADPGLSRPLCALQQGVCNGKRHDAGQCVGGAWQACTATQYGPDYGSEVCDLKDNDCNGLTDAADDANLVKPDCELQAGVCLGKKKTKELCVSGSWQVCTATQYGAGYSTTEICDNLDNNCDGYRDNNVGQTDNTLTGTCYTGPAGTANVGMCRSGSRVCSNGTWGACTGQVLPCNGATPCNETCDNIDNNCDGYVDNATGGGNYTLTQSCYPCGSGTPGLGPCRSGTQQCSSSGWGGCSGFACPATEVCNNYDDNCNGVIDDGPWNQLCPPRANVASETCSSGTCVITSCVNQNQPSGYHNLDGVATNGCECQDDAASRSCASATAINGGVAIATGSQATYTGKVPVFSASLDDWLLVKFTNSVDYYSRSSHTPWITLSSPSGNLRFEVRSNCSTTRGCATGGGGALATGLTDWALSDTCGPNGRGDANPCYARVGQPWPSDAYVRVYRIATNASMCEQYTLTASLPCTDRDTIPASCGEGRYNLGTLYAGQAVNSPVGRIIPIGHPGYTNEDWYVVNYPAQAVSGGTGYPGTPRVYFDINDGGAYRFEIRSASCPGGLFGGCGSGLQDWYWQCQAPGICLSYPGFPTTVFIRVYRANTVNNGATACQRYRLWVGR